MRTLAASALALLALAGAARADSWSALRRPLVPKPLAVGARCPVTPARRLDRGRLPDGLGAGPVYPMPGPFGRDDRHPAWLSAKTLWGWPPRLLTAGVRVLVRGRRLDGAGTMRFQLGPDWGTTPLTRELRLDTTKAVGDFGNSRWGATVALLFVRSHGCYGLQLDSERGTTVVVLRG